MKTQYRLFVFILAILLALQGNVLPGAAAASSGEEEAVTVRHIDGEASARRGEESVRLAAGDSLFVGDVILTGADSLAIVQLADGKQIYIGADSVLEIVALPQEGEGNDTALYLEDGNVISVINRALAEDEAYTVETPALVMAIRGTIASVRSEGNGEASRVALFEGSGAVHMKSGGGIYHVQWGEWLKASGNEARQEAIAPSKLARSEKRFLFAENAFYEGEVPMPERLAPLLALDGFEEAESAYEESLAQAADKDSADMPAKTKKPKRTKTPKTESPTEKPTKAPAKESATEKPTKAPAKESPTEKPTKTPAPESPAPTAKPEKTAAPTEKPEKTEAATEKPTKTPKPEEDSDEGISLKKAKSIFSAKHPDAEITVAKKEGDVYYIEGKDGNTIYKMKIKVSSGKIVLDKEITRGKGR